MRAGCSSDVDPQAIPGSDRVTMPETRPRLLGPISLIALGLNGVVGVGIFFVPGSVAKHVPGGWGAGVYLLTACACLPVALAFARLGRRFDQDGGPYVFAREAFGPNIAYLVGWLTYASAVFSTSAVIRGLAQALTSEFAAASPIVTNGLASLIALVLAAVVAAGLRISAWTWTAVTVAKLVPLLGLLVAAIIFVPVIAAPAAPTAAAVVACEPSARGVLRAALVALFALQGFEIVAVPAGHVRRAQSVATATMVALVGAASLYVALHLACVRAVPALAASRAPLVDAARGYGGPAFARVLEAGTTISALGIAFGMMAMTPRYLAAVGRHDGLGAWLGQSSRRGVPLRALAITCAIVFVLVQFGSLEQLFALSSVAVLTQYFSKAAALTCLASKRALGLGPAELAIGILACYASLAVASGATLWEVARAAAVLLLGVLLKVAIGTRARPVNATR